MARVEWDDTAVLAAIDRATLEGLEDAAEYLLETANRTVPIEEGTLGRSGSVSSDRTLLAACISYDTPYAVVQHEVAGFRHDPGRRAKWLQLTLNERGPRITEFLARRLKDRLR